LVLAFFYYQNYNVVGYVFVLDYPISSIMYWIGVIVIAAIIYGYFNKRRR